MSLNQIGRYQVLNELGSGGFASVYLAEDPSLETQVAVKVLADRLAVDGDIRARFIDEARFLRRLAAPGLVAVHDIGEEDGVPYFVMEYCERGTLADRLDRMGRPVTLEEGMQLARVLAAGVDVVHRAGVVHRDLKPSNFMIRRVDHATRTVIGAVLDQDEELVVGDFGLAKIINTDASRLTLAGGTPGFSAPEQFLGDGSVDATADVYAASATLVAAMSGVNPSTDIARTDDVFPPEAMTMTGPLAEELTRGLSLERSTRHADIRQWYAALEIAAKNESAGAPSIVEAVAGAAVEGPNVAQAYDLGIEHLTDVRVIGEGGFSVVYGARHSLLNQPVAIKMLSRQLRESDRRRFERECDVMGRMSKHPNVVTVHTAGYNDQHVPYVMMELVEGGTYADLLARRGPIPWDEAVDLITPVAEALGHAHEQGILHRDIKPENILLDDGVPKLTDFGIAVLRDSTGATSTHVTASWLHTAPETFDNDRDERADLYSLASTLYHLVAGQAPFWRPNDESLGPLMKRLINDPPPRLDESQVPAGTNEFFSLALAKHPAHRPQTAGAFAGSLVSVGSGDDGRSTLAAPLAAGTIVRPDGIPRPAPPPTGTDLGPDDELKSTYQLKSRPLLASESGDVRPLAPAVPEASGRMPRTAALAIAAAIVVVLGATAAYIALSGRSGGAGVAAGPDTSQTATTEAPVGTTVTSANSVTVPSSVSTASPSSTTTQDESGAASSTTKRPTTTTTSPTTTSTTSVPTPKGQTITFNPLGPYSLGDVVDLVATSTGGLPVTFEKVSGNCGLTEEGRLFPTAGSDDCVVTVSQAGDGDAWAPAPPLTRTIGIVGPTDLSVTVSGSTDNVSIGIRNKGEKTAESISLAIVVSGCQVRQIQQSVRDLSANDATIVAAPNPTRVSSSGAPCLLAQYSVEVTVSSSSLDVAPLDNMATGQFAW